MVTYLHAKHSSAQYDLEESLSLAGDPMHTFHSFSRLLGLSPEGTFRSIQTTTFICSSLHPNLPSDRMHMYAGGLCHPV